MMLCAPVLATAPPLRTRTTTSFPPGNLIFCSQQPYSERMPRHRWPLLAFVVLATTVFAAGVLLVGVTHIATHGYITKPSACAVK